VSAILGTFEEDDGCHPVVYTLAFANCHGRILFVCSGPKPDGIEEKEYLTFGNREEPTYMRQMLLYYLGTTNVLVGFHLGWLLAALNLALPAHRVVELGEEPAFQMYVRNIASSTYPREFFKVKQSPSFDRRWPAILSGYLFNFGSTAESVLRECFYIAALWQLLHQPIVDRRNNVAVYRLKCAYVVGVGCDVREDEFKWIDDSLDHPHTICLTNMKIKETGARKGEERSVISNSLDCTEERWLEFLNEKMAANVIAVIADGKDIRDLFRLSCVRLSLQRNVVDNIEWLDPFLEETQEFNQRCPFAVDMALPSWTITRQEPVFVDWINHCGRFTIPELRTIAPSLPDLIASIVPNQRVYRLISSFADLGKDPNLMRIVCEATTSPRHAQPCPDSEENSFSQFAYETYMLRRSKSKNTASSDLKTQSGGATPKTVGPPSLRGRAVKRCVEQAERLEKLSGKLDPNYHIGKKSAAAASAASSSTPAPAPSAPGKYPGGAKSPPFIELSDSSSDGETVSA